MTQFPTPERKDLASTIGRNTLFGFAATLTFFVTRLVTVPIVIRHLGLDGYGIWSIIMVTAAYMRTGSAGVKCAFQKYVAEATGSGDFERANRLISTGTALLFVVSMIAVTPISMFSTQLATIAGVPTRFLQDASSSITLLAFIILVANAGAGFESIVTGAQRFDLVRKINILCSVCEAICIVLLLHFGKGLVAMSAVMGISELSYIGYCIFISRRVLPQIRIKPRYISRSVLKELVLFAGSYQLVNFQEVIYVAILPIVILKDFGATATGVYALAAKLVQVSMMAQDNFLLPILSGSSLVFASGSAEDMKVLVLKAFKTTFGLSAIPLGVICATGTTIIYAWTGRRSDLLEPVLVLMSLASLFAAISLLQLVLYRASGKSLMDNVRQVIRIAFLLLVGAAGAHLGLVGTLGGFALTEFASMMFMFFALNHAFPWFRVRVLIPDTLKLMLAATATAILSMLVVKVPVPAFLAERSAAVVHTCAVGGFTLAAALPLLLLTKALSAAEFHVIRRLIPGHTAS